tara:strand:- start:17184 stop:17591 length:408 start_codon:yes stop_codon:yes gene_type:complete
MAGINKVMLIGNLGKDPEIRHLDSGVAVANFSLATTETYTNKQGEKVSQTEWHNIVLWRGLADVAEKYLKKGSSVYIEGKLQYRTWEDDNGNTRYSTDIRAEKMTMLGSKNSLNDLESPSNPSSKDVSENDDLPF